MTNLEFVERLESAAAHKTMYMWGGIYRKITPSYAKMLYQQYPYKYSENRRNQIDSVASSINTTYGCDCAGLIKAFAYFGGIGSPDYDVSLDYNVNMFMSASPKTGPIDSMPYTTVGLGLYTPGHCGVYLGDNMYIECNLTNQIDGVYLGRFDPKRWQSYFYIPHMEYNANPQGKFSILINGFSSKEEAEKAITIVKE